MTVAGDPLPNWRDGATKSAIIDFVASVDGADGSRGVPPDERVAVFDNDGTLWCEKPMPIQLDFILRRLSRWPRPSPTLRDRQPWKSASTATTRGSARSRWPRTTPAMTPTVEIVAGGHPRRLRRDQRGGVRASGRRLPGSPPSTRRWAAAYVESAYVPMVELLDLLESHGFTNYIVSGGGRDFMRPISQSRVRRPPRAGHRQQHHAGLRGAARRVA